MAELKEHLSKLRDERVAREKARIDKLREINIKKYNSNESNSSKLPISTSTISVGKKPTKDISTLGSKSARNLKSDIKPKTLEKPTRIPAGVKQNLPKNQSNLNGPTKGPITSNVPNRSSISAHSKDSVSNLKPKTVWKSNINNNKAEKTFKEPLKINAHPKLPTNPINVDRKTMSKTNDSYLKAKWDNSTNANKPGPSGDAKNIPKYTRKSLAPTHVDTIDAKNAPKMVRKSFAPTRVDTVDAKNAPKIVRKSFAPRFAYQNPIITVTNPTPNPKTTQPKSISNDSKVDDGKKQSVFERLYQPKIKPKTVENDAQKLKNDPKFLNKLLKNTRLILNKRHTVFEQPKVYQQPVRRSISAVHFKRLSKNELSNCIHKWSSIGDKLDKVSLEDINEDDNVIQDKIVSAVKSERKVKFLTPMANFKTPKPDELQRRLQNWLKKRGKSLDSYHHLQCFGINHLVQRERDIRPLNLDKANFVPETSPVEPLTKVNQEDEVIETEDRFVSFDDENKENEPLASDSDNESYTDNMNDRADDPQLQYSRDKWRKASFVSDSHSIDLNDTQDTTLTTVTEPGHHVNEVLLGALNDLTEILKEGFDWEQSASWLRAIRERFPNASDTAAYWECRAALEERRGDLPASVQCWEQAIAKGTEHSVVEANLDQLLDKFMQLKISPNSGRSRQPDPKMVDVKNVFKSTLIRFAVQQAKLRQSEAPKFTVTPVRRSARLSMTGQRSVQRIQCSAQRAVCSGQRTPLRVCTTVRQAALLGHPVTFVPNDKLAQTP